MLQVRLKIIATDSFIPLNFICVSLQPCFPFDQFVNSMLTINFLSFSITASIMLIFWSDSLFIVFGKLKKKTSFTYCIKCCHARCWWVFELQCFHLNTARVKKKNTKHTQKRVYTHSLSVDIRLKCRQKKTALVPFSLSKSVSSQPAHIHTREQSLLHRHNLFLTDIHTLFLKETHIISFSHTRTTNTTHTLATAWNNPGACVWQSSLHPQ